MPADERDDLLGSAFEPPGSEAHAAVSEVFLARTREEWSAFAARVDCCLEPVLDLDYSEDSSCGTDMNVVMTGAGHFVEVQGTAEGAPFDRALLEKLLDLATAGCAELAELQRKALA